MSSGSFLMGSGLQCALWVLYAHVYSYSVQSIRVSREVAQSWERTETKVMNLAGKVIDTFMPQGMTLLQGLRLSPLCMSDLHRVMHGIRDVEPWAFSMIDASGISPDGMFVGALSALGHYGQCLDIIVPSDKHVHSVSGVVSGQYCAVNIKPPLPPKTRFYTVDKIFPGLENVTKKDTVHGEFAKSITTFYSFSVRLNLCVPSTCTTQDVNTAVSAVGKEFLLNVTVDRCDVKEPTVYTAAQIGIICTFLLLVCIAFVASIIDVSRKKMKYSSNSTSIRVLLAFSVPRNFQKLMDTSKPSGNLACISGLKFISMTWIILGHGYIMNNFYALRGMHYTLYYPRDFLFQAVNNTTLSVDTFFFISGLLLCYNMVYLLRDMKKSFSFKVYLLHRYSRLAPGNMALVGMMLLEPLFKSGPIWDDLWKYMVSNCRRNWWKNLLFINNFQDIYDTCLPHMWYLASDFQLYLFSLIVLLPLIRYPKIGITLNAVFILASILACGAVTYIMELTPTLMYAPSELEKQLPYVHWVYFKPYPYFGPYGIGLYIGYLLATRKNPTLRPVVHITGWLVAIACNLSVLYGTYNWNSEGHSPKPLETLLYASLHRTTWAVGVAWLVWSCATGYGGIVNKILTSKLWIPLGRLTFMVYLIHPVILMTVTGQLQFGITASHHLAVWGAFSQLVLSYTLACVASLLVETPLMVLEKMLLEAKWKNSAGNK